VRQVRFPFIPDVRGGRPLEVGESQPTLPDDTPPETADGEVHRDQAKAFERALWEQRDHPDPFAVAFEPLANNNLVRVASMAGGQPGPSDLSVAGAGRPSDSTAGGG